MVAHALGVNNIPAGSFRARICGSRPAPLGIEMNAPGVSFFAARHPETLDFLYDEGREASKMMDVGICASLAIPAGRPALRVSSTL
jgi:hypothetical protein